MIGWSEPWMLLALAAVGLPVAVHFLTRARSRVIRLPTFHLLVAAGSGRQRLHRLRTFAVLALRTLLIAALVLAFARPMLRSPSAAGPEDGQVRRAVVIVDASMSMTASRGGLTLFTKARSDAADLLRSFEPGSAAGVILLGATPRPILPALSRNLTALHDELAAAEPTWQAGDPAAALDLASRLLDGRGEVFVFSDFQRTNWATADFSRHPGLRFALRPVAEAAVENVGITSVRCAPGRPTDGERIELICELFNAAPAGRRETIRLDTETVSLRREVSIRPYSSAEAVFEFASPPTGVWAGRVSLDADALPCDNTRYFSLDVSPSLTALLVSDADAQDHNSAAFFLESALNTSSDAAQGVRLIRRRGQDVDQASLETAEVFVLACPVRLSGPAVDAIARRVTDGAQLACFLTCPGQGRDGGQACADLLASLGGASKGMISPPFALGPPVGNGNAPAAAIEGARLASVQVSAEALGVLGDPDAVDLGQWRFARYLAAPVDQARQAEVLLAYEDGSAALSVSPAGQGLVVFANLPIEPEASNIAGSPLFPVLVHELLRNLRRGEQVVQHHPGLAWTFDAPLGLAGSGADGSVTVLDPDGQPLAATVLARGRSVRLALPPVERVGHYRVSERRGGEADSSDDGPPRLVAIAAVNVDAAESDTRSLDLKHLVDQPNAAGGNVVVVNDQNQVVAVGRDRPLWPILLALAAAAMLGEMLVLAFWSTRPTGGGRSIAQAKEAGHG